MKRLNITDEEYEIVEEEALEEWEAFKYEYLKKNNHKPSETQKKKFIEDYIQKNAIPIKEHIRQSEKESGQLECLKTVFIEDRRQLTIEEISEVLMQSGFSKGSSVKTIYRRIIPELEKLNIKKGIGGKYYYDPNTDKIIAYSRMIEAREINSHDKIESLTIISNFLETIKDSPVYEKAKDFLEKEKDKLDYSNDYKENFSRIVFTGAPQSSINQEFWDKIYEAMQHNNPINIQYRGEGKKDCSLYTLRPYQLIFDNGSWELWAECLKKKHEGMKLFNLSRIKRVDILKKEENFLLPSDYNFLHTLSGNFGCYNDRTPRLYKIKFEKDSYAYLYSKDRIWGDNQNFEETDDGFILTFEASQFKPILRWVLGWGPEVRPLEPSELVDIWKAKIQKMAQEIKNP